MERMKCLRVSNCSRCANTKPLCFSDISKKYWSVLFRIALNYYANIHDAEDTVQDVMVKLYASGKEFENEEHLRNWLIRVTINSCKNFLSSFWRRKKMSLEVLSEIAVWDDSEESELWMTVMSLREKYRTVVFLHHFEGFTTKEIAEMLGQTDLTIRARLLRARKQLKEVLQDEEVF